MINILVDEAGVEFEKDEAALKKYFNIFNEDYFDGKLDPERNLVGEIYKYIRG